jgi:aminoglycoside phosphotransferase (APT) family kinase protein
MLEPPARERIAAGLAAAGFTVNASDIRVEARDDRWLVRLPGPLLAWLAMSERGIERLAAERRVLRLVGSRCSFRVPRVLFESVEGDLDVREPVPGATDPWAAYSAVRDHPERATEIGAALGTLLAQQHSRIAATDVASWLPSRPEWPEPREWIAERLPSVVDDTRLIDRALTVVDEYEHVPVEDTDRVLVHADLGLHNVALDPNTGALNGVFDYDAAAWADRHHDFRYLILDLESHALLDAAVAAYEPVVGRVIRRERVLLYNAACAISYLAYRAGRAPEERWCGRTLAEDLSWSRGAIAAAER